MSSNSAFHPALTGVLYGVLAQHEQALMQMQLAANLTQSEIDGETADRYTGIVDGLKRMLAMTEPYGAGQLSLEHIEKMQRSYALLGRLLSQLSEFDIWSWNIHSDGVDANLRAASGTSNEDIRACMRAVAERIGIGYVEKYHGTGASTLIVCAKGDIDGISVRIYDLIEAERPICDTHHQMVDADGACPECAAASIVHALMPDGAEMPRCGADVNSLIALVAESVTCPECVARLAADGGTASCAQTAAPVESEFVNVDDALATTSEYRADQLGGVACASCGNAFADDEQGVRVGDTSLGVIADIGLYAHAECVDSVHPELKEDAS